MKLIATMLVAATALTGCTSSSSSWRYSVDGYYLLEGPRADGFGPSETLAVKRDGAGIHWDERLRSGISADGRRGYFYYTDREVYLEGDDFFGKKPDGIAPIDANCREDFMTGAAECYVEISYGLTIDVTTSGGVKRVCVNGHDFPGEVARIRVDNRPIISTGESGCLSGGAARSLVAQLRNAERLRLQRVEWPYDVWVETDHRLAGGVGLALDLFTFVHSGRFQAGLFAETGQTPTGPRVQ